MPAPLLAILGAAGAAASVPSLIELLDEVSPEWGVNGGAGTDILGRRKRLGRVIESQARVESTKGLEYFMNMQREKDLRATIMNHLGTGRGTPGTSEMEKALSERGLLATLEQKYARQLGSVASEQNMHLTSAAELAGQLGFEA